MSTEITTSATQQFRGELTKMEAQFETALPAHMPVERFMRVVLTAVNADPDLLNADRRSLMESAMKAAQDGLLPDKREGALVVFNTKVKAQPARGGKPAVPERWIKKVQWMPMVGGILKKVRNSGQVSTIVARVVYEGDKFRCWIDDKGEHIEYEAGEHQNRNVVRKVFAMAVLKDGGVEIEPMTPEEIEQVRRVSKNADKGPWQDWWDEMAKKTALRRLAKRLPLSSDLDDLVRRDDDIYDLKANDSAGQHRALFSPPAKGVFDDEDEGGAGETTAQTRQREPEPPRVRGHALAHSHTSLAPDDILDEVLALGGDINNASDVREAIERLEDRGGAAAQDEGGDDEGGDLDAGGNLEGDEGDQPGDEEPPFEQDEPSEDQDEDERRAAQEAREREEQEAREAEEFERREREKAAAQKAASKTKDAPKAPRGGKAPANDPGAPSAAQGGGSEEDVRPTMKAPDGRFFFDIGKEKALKQMPETFIPIDIREMTPGAEKEQAHAEYKAGYAKGKRELAAKK